MRRNWCRRVRRPSQTIWKSAQTRNACIKRYGTRWNFCFSTIPSIVPFAISPENAGFRITTWRMPATTADIHWDRKHARKAYNLGPLVKLDQERCILCTRCVRFTRNVTKTNEIQVFSRGHNSEIGIFEEKPLNNAYSGNVVDVCPVGALTSADFRFKVRVWFLKGTPSVCAGCSTGCNLRIDHSARATGGGISGYTATDGKIYRTVGRRNVEVNKSWLCDEGRLSFHQWKDGRVCDMQSFAVRERTLIELCRHTRRFRSNPTTE